MHVPKTNIVQGNRREPSHSSVSHILLHPTNSKKHNKVLHSTLQKGITSQQHNKKMKCHHDANPAGNKAAKYSAQQLPGISACSVVMDLLDKPHPKPISHCTGIPACITRCSASKHKGWRTPARTDVKLCVAGRQCWLGCLLCIQEFKGRSSLQCRLQDSRCLFRQGSLMGSFATVGLTTEILGTGSSSGFNPTHSIGVTGVCFHSWRSWSLLVTDRE